MGSTALELIAAADVSEQDARRLLLAAAQRTPAWLVGDPVVSPEISARFDSAVRRRRAGEPLQYIEGSVQFGPLMLKVDARALIPRPETERLWELATGLIGDQTHPTIVDLCTGSGNLALALKFRFPDARVIGADLSVDAISLAKENAAGLGLDVEFVVGDLFSALDGSLRRKIDLVVSNPPYVSSRDWEQLPPEVRDFEPFDALVGGVRGTEVLSAIAAAAQAWLKPGGSVICEIGETQGDECGSLFAAYHPEILEDLTKRPRYVVGSVSQK